MKIKANHIELHCELSGRPDGEIVVLSHVIGSSLVMWEPQMEVLKHKFRVLRYDTRGLGLSSVPQGPYSMDQLVQDAAGLLDALEFDRVHWVGLSLGAMIGMGLAIHHPERLRSLTLCDAMASVRESGKQLWKDRLAATSMESLAEGAASRWFTAPYRESNAPGYQLNRSQFLSTSLAGYLGNCHAIMNLDYMDELESIRTPTCIIVGEHDQATPIAESIAIRDRIEGAEMHVIKGGAHLCNVEQPERFNAVLAEFLSRL